MTAEEAKAAEEMATAMTYSTSTLSIVTGVVNTLLGVGA
jgi:hypothetical protein